MLLGECLGAGEWRHNLEAKTCRGRDLSTIEGEITQRPREAIGGGKMYGVDGS